MTRYLIEVQAPLGTLEEALAQQLWLTTWVQMHSDVVRPGWGIQVKALIPPVTYEEDDPPRAGGLIARAEIDFQLTVESDSGQVLLDCYTELATQIQSICVDVAMTQVNVTPGL